MIRTTCNKIPHYILLIIINISLLATFTPLQAAAGEMPSKLVRDAIEKAVMAVKPALVRIHVVSAEYYEGKESKSESFGSGFIISKEGYVITNHHVAGDAKQIICTLANKEEIDAELVGTDPMTDIAVIKLLPPTKRVFPTAKFGDSSKIKVGDYVFAMGSPLAFSQSVTMGVVSNTELVIPETWGMDFKLDGEDVGSMVRWIGHDAAIYGGNSGGPLVNLNGEVIGINEIRIGLGGAIPSNLAKQVSEQIIKHGKIIRSWIGVCVQPLLKSTKVKNGVLISGVISGSPAEKAGIKSGDILLKIGGRDVSVRFKEELPPFNQIMAALPIGKPVKAVILRNGKQIVVSIVPEEREPALARPQEFKQWGICASNITFLKAKELKRNSRNGVLVRSVRPGGPAGTAKPNLKEDDVIIEVGGKPVNNINDLAKLTEEITKDKTEPTPTLVAFERSSEKFLTVVKVGIRELKDPGLELSKAWLPVSTQVLTRDLAKVLGIEGKMGVRVTKVYPNAKIDLRVGDIITKVDGELVPASQPEDEEVLSTMIRQYPIGSKVELTVLHNNEEIKVPVELPASPKLPREMKKYQDINFDFIVRDIAFLDRVEEGWPENQEGVIVESVSEGGWAALGNLLIGDLICTVDNQQVKNVQEFQKIMARIANEKRKMVVFQIKRGIQEMFIEIRPTWSRVP
ncbi:MAG: PDZ domain-containing protein [Armatimonadetes bacterium]|nr:PDZ domain-containing protein [Armatimonadota bacterium]